jgi:hypothetical protein
MKLIPCRRNLVWSADGFNVREVPWLAWSRLDHSVDPRGSNVFRNRLGRTYWVETAIDKKSALKLSADFV